MSRSSWFVYKEQLVNNIYFCFFQDSYAKFLPLGVGLCCLGKQEQAEATVEALAVLPDPFKSMAMTMVDICAYAGTGNVLKIQSLLHICR